MSNETTVKGKLGDLQLLMSSLATNSGELAHLELSRARFAELVATAKSAAERHAQHAAAKQEASRELQLSLVEALRMANVLRLAIKQHYGIRSEKLAEFGLQPFRGRKAKPDAEEAQPSAPPPAEPIAPSSEDSDRD